MSVVSSMLHTLSTYLVKCTFALVINVKSASVAPNFCMSYRIILVIAALSYKRYFFIIWMLEKNILKKLHKTIINTNAFKTNEM